MAYHDLPAAVTLQEEGPREGFQSEPPIAVADKLRLIHALAETGLRDIDCVSFVDTRRVPQMADAEEVAAGIQRKDGVRYFGIWLNTQGFERALAAGVDIIPNLLVSVSDTFARKNNGCGAAELIRKQGTMLELYRDQALSLQTAYVSTAFGCQYEGASSPEDCVATVADLLAVCADFGAAPGIVYLADTVGAANPRQIHAVLESMRSRWPDQQFALHLHDTRGMGLANMLAALQLGIARFDTSIGGMGGCPFAGNRAAAGNICTEDVALMCEEMGVRTGLDLDALAACGRLAEAIVAHPLPGKFMKGGAIRPRASGPLAA